MATHPRRYDQGAQIEDPAHLAELSARKREARRHRAQDRLAQAVPSSRDLLLQAATRGDNLGSITAALLRLLERYGAAELQAAIGEALAREVPHPNAVRLALERRREQREQPPPLAVALPADPRVRDLVVQPHRLGDYDQLQTPRRTPMSAPTDPLLARAQALKLDGLAGPWQAVARAPGWCPDPVGGGGAHSAFPAAAPGQCRPRALQTLGRLRLVLAEALRT